MASEQLSAVSKETETKTMQSKSLFWLVINLLWVTFSSTEAQQAKKLTRIGYFAAPDSATESARAEGLRRALRELGYVDGQTIVIDYRYSEGNVERAPDGAAEIVNLNP